MQSFSVKQESDIKSVLRGDTLSIITDFFFCILASYECQTHFHCAVIYFYVVVEEQVFMLM